MTAQSLCLRELGMSVLIRRNAPDLEERKKRPPTGQVAVIVDSLWAEFSKFLSSLSEEKNPPSMEKLYKRDLLHSLGGRLLGGLVQLCVLMLNGVEQSCS